MKRFTKNMTLAVAALALAAGTVSAQTMKAEIPFAFRVGKQLMQPGEYQVRVLSSASAAGVLTVANSDTKKTVIVLPMTRSTPPEAWIHSGLARARFACVEGSCSLESLWIGDGDAYIFHPTRRQSGEVKVAEITLRPDRAN